MSDKQLVTALNSLVKPVSRKELKPLEPRGALAGKRATAEYKAPATGTGGGIASPLTEASYAAREYWPVEVLTSSDGLLTFRVKPIKKIVQADANDAEVVQIFAQPVATP